MIFVRVGVAVCIGLVGTAYRTHDSSVPLVADLACVGLGCLPDMPDEFAVSIEVLSPVTGEAEISLFDGAPCWLLCINFLSVYGYEPAKRLWPQECHRAFDLFYHGWRSLQGGTCI